MDFDRLDADQLRVLLKLQFELDDIAFGASFCEPKDLEDLAKFDKNKLAVLFELRLQLDNLASFP